MSTAAPLRMQIIFRWRAHSLFELAREVQIAVTPIQPKDDLASTVHGLFTRALCWSKSIYRLDDLVSDFQAHSAGARAMFELLVDIVLLSKGCAPLEVLLAWEDASRLKGAKRTLEDGTAQSFIEADMKAFVARQEPISKAARAKHWPSHNSLPNRWTGKNLIEDGRRIEQLGKYGADEIVSTHYDMLNWNTHGSGLTVARRFDAEQILNVTMMALYLSTESLTHVIRETLDHFKLLDDDWKKKIQLARTGRTEEEIQRAIAAHEARTAATGAT